MRLTLKANIIEVGGCITPASVLLITKLTSKRNAVVIVDFDPRDDREEVERHHGGSFSEYFETRTEAELALASRAGTCI
jgi:hypothetical protein